MEKLCDDRSDCAARHDDRSFGAEWTTRSERDCGKERLLHLEPPSDPPSAAPSGAPDPIEIADESGLRTASRGCTLLPLIRMDSSASGMPWPRMRSEP